jgi:hypothetical protein
MKAVFLSHLLHLERFRYEREKIFIEDLYLMGYNAMQSGESNPFFGSEMFLRNISRLSLDDVVLYLRR